VAELEPNTGGISVRPDSDGTDSSMSAIGCLGVATLGRRRAAMPAAGGRSADRRRASQGRPPLPPPRTPARGIDSSGAPTFGYRLVASAVSVTPWIILLMLTDARAQVPTPKCRLARGQSPGGLN